MGDPKVRGGVRWPVFVGCEVCIMTDGRAGRSGVDWKGVELMSAAEPMRGVFIWEGVAARAFRKDMGDEESAEKESRGHLRLWASSSETRRSIWWSVTLRMALRSVFRRRAAFYGAIVRDMRARNARQV